MITNMTEKELKAKVKDILDSLKWLQETHDCHLELGDISDDKVIIYCGGKGGACEIKCIEEALAVKFPHLKVIYR